VCNCHVGSAVADLFVVRQAAHVCRARPLGRPGLYKLYLPLGANAQSNGTHAVAICHPLVFAARLGGAVKASRFSRRVNLNEAYFTC
jgi:hypothetical protein